jgi:hypothetical protein
MPCVSLAGQRLFADTSVRAMHRYRLPAVSASYPPAQEADNDPLMTEPVFDGDEELGTEEEGQMVAYAHRDIKPG